MLPISTKFAFGFGKKRSLFRFAVKTFTFLIRKLRFQVDLTQDRKSKSCLKFRSDLAHSTLKMSKSGREIWPNPES